jgi:hypothetical protein
LILSSSSFAFLSASAKSTGFVLAAPNPSLDFLAPEEAPRPEAEDAELRREVDAPRREGREAEDDVMVDEDVIVLGAGVVVVDEAVVVEDADVARPITGGVPVRGVAGAEDFGVLGFDQDSKKSSSVSSLAGMGVDAVSMPSTWIP